jgi:tetratricopeptide (TPR) repeat protein
MASPLLRARTLLKRRRFTKVIAELSPHIFDYEDSFEFHYLLGTACLYLGDFGGAEGYYRKARKIHLQDANMLLGIAVIHLCHGETDRALGIYLDVRDKNPRNKTASRALDFIKHNGAAPNLIQDWKERGKLRRFYPPLGTNPRIIQGIVAAVVLGALVYFGGPRLMGLVKQQRALRPQVSAEEWASLSLSREEGVNAAGGDLTSGVFRYILTDKEVLAAYDSARSYFQQNRDNAAQVEINRILGSNASPAVRQKARLLMNYLTVPTFDTLGARDRFTYKQVAADPHLYLDCYVQWSGMVSNVRGAGPRQNADFLVGYDTRSTLEGIVPLRFQADPTMDAGRPVQVLAKITLDDGKLTLEALSLYQAISRQ